jgi:hypothetical protein
LVLKGIIDALSQSKAGVSAAIVLGTNFFWKSHEADKKKQN